MMRGVPTTTRAGIITSLSTKKDLRVYSVTVSVVSDQRRCREGGGRGEKGRREDKEGGGATKSFANKSQTSCPISVAGP